MIIDEEVYLEHYGVKGMKWGVRHDPKSNGKAGDAFDDLPLEAQRAVVQAVGLSFVGVALAIQHTLSSGNARRLIKKGTDFITRKSHDPWKKKPELAKKNMSTTEIMEKVVKPINPSHPHGVGSKMNCRRCTYAYEMRRRGNDVAATRTPYATGQEQTGNYNVLNPGVNLVAPGQSGIATRLAFEKLHKKSNRPFTAFIDKGRENPSLMWGEIAVQPKKAFSEVAKMPNGARGELGIAWWGGGGHSIAWENVNGKAVFFDNQNGVKYENQHDFNEYAESMSLTALTRLDNRPLNDDFLRRWIKNA